MFSSILFSTFFLSRSTFSLFTFSFFQIIPIKGWKKENEKYFFITCVYSIVQRGVAYKIDIYYRIENEFYLCIIIYTWKEVCRYDWSGRVLNLWNGTGESRDHSRLEAVWDSIQNCGVDSKNAGTCQGLASTGFPFTRMS